MKLLIVEQKEDLKLLEGCALSDDIEVIITKGSLWQFPRGSLAIDIHDNFRTDFVLKPRKDQILERILSLGKYAEKIFLVFPQTPKGHFISSRIADELETKELPSKYIPLSAAKKLKQNEWDEINQSYLQQFIDAHKVRKIVARLIEYKLAPFVWFKGHPDFHLNYTQIILIHAQERLEARSDFSSSKDIAAFMKKNKISMVKVAHNCQALVEAEFFFEENNRFALTDQGHDVASAIELVFPGTLLVKILSRVEVLLAQAEEGKIPTYKVLKDFWEIFEVAVAKAQEKVEEIKAQEVITDIICAKCDSHKMKIKWGKRGEFLACESFPECTGTENFQRVDDEIQIIPKEYFHKGCPECHKRMEVQTGRFGRYAACEDYPKCRTTLPFTLEIHCPLCKAGNYVEKKSRFGKIFYGCSNYPSCEHAIWSIPVERECPDCLFPIMGVREGKKLGRHLECPKCHEKVEIIDEVEV